MLVGSLASSSDPELILEVLNFMLSSEVSSFQILFELYTNIITYRSCILSLLVWRLICCHKWIRFEVRMLFLDFLSIGKEETWLGHGLRYKQHITVLQ
jgi:hypothetical protein